MDSAGTSKEKALDVFISGEIIDLCIPTREFINAGVWHNWFNKSKVTRYLEQGIYPNSIEDQMQFFEMQKGQNRLTLIISNKSKYLGVISLSSIDFNKKKCDIALVIDNAEDFRMSPYIALESMARMSEHAFIKMGMNRIEAGQHVDLVNWQQRMELLGYKLEGLHKGKFVKGREIADTVSLCCTVDSYDNIFKHRNKLWDSFHNMRQRMKLLPKLTSQDKFRDFQKELEEYYSVIHKL